MRTMSEQGIALIKRFEGFSALPYICPAGKKTIGYGHVLLPHEAFPPEGISKSEAESLLREDVAMAERAVDRLVPADVTQGQFDALASLAYNIGVYAFEKSTLLKYIATGRADKAAQELGRWVYSGGKKLPGLVSRRAAEKALFLS